MALRRDSLKASDLGLAAPEDEEALDGAPTKSSAPPADPQHPWLTKTHNSPRSPSALHPTICHNPPRYSRRPELSAALMGSHTTVRDDASIPAERDFNAVP
jgi:hypothetical protein